MDTPWEENLCQLLSWLLDAFIAGASSNDFFSTAMKNLKSWLVVQSEPLKEEP